jgi:hypothetical protein
VVATLERVCRTAGYPKAIRVDQGSEFISRDLDLWAYARGVTLDFSRPGKPTDNAFAEAFNSRVRAECMNAHWFLRLRTPAKSWRLGADTTTKTARMGRSAISCRSRCKIPVAQPARHRERRPETLPSGAPTKGTGKAQRPYAFGVKVSVATPLHRCAGGQFGAHVKARPGHPSDGHTLGAVLPEIERTLGADLVRVVTDAGYQGHSAPQEQRVSMGPARSGDYRWRSSGPSGAARRSNRRSAIPRASTGWPQ